MKKRRIYDCRCVVFEDEGFSGGKLLRPDFKRMDVVSDDGDLIEQVATREAVRQLHRAVDAVLTDLE